MLTINRSVVWEGVAEILEKNPERYNFWQSLVPEPGKSGCILALAGEVMGMEPKSRSHDVLIALGLSHEMSFFLSLGNWPSGKDFVRNGGRTWVEDPQLVAARLRVLAHQEVAA